VPADIVTLLYACSMAALPLPIGALSALALLNVMSAMRLLDALPNTSFMNMPTAARVGLMRSRVSGRYGCQSPVVP
jgi:hypothetical protein